VPLRGLRSAHVVTTTPVAVHPPDARSSTPVTRCQGRYRARP
jgi:hypothetical protein